MNILLITHADFEGPGVVAPWVGERGHVLTLVKPYKGDPVPAIDDFDMLIIMGGPQSPNKAEEFPYLKDEMELIQAAIDQHKKVLGFCLGAQLIGAALGAPTIKSPEKEIGVFPVHLTEEGRKDRLLSDFDVSFPAIHWHSDMPGLTESAVVLAHSAGCPRQIIRYGKNIYGFQCHLEITLQGVKDLIEAVPDDFGSAPFLQSEEEFLAQDFASIHKRIYKILDRF